MKLASFVIPTFKEKDNIEVLIQSFSHIESSNIDIIIVNGNPHDDTSSWLKNCGDKRIIELDGNPDLYWSGLINVGLRHTLNAQEKPEYVFIMNADIKFTNDILSLFFNQAKELPPCQLAAVTIANSQIVSSGVKVRSWFLTVNQHPLAGSSIEELKNDQIIPVDYLPTRCVMVPFSAILKAGLTSEKLLPHYGGDHEYTSRINNLGYKAYIATKIRVELNKDSTGEDVYVKDISFWERIKKTNSIKSPSNPISNIIFVYLVYPWYSIPTATILYLTRSFLEIFFGGKILKKIFKYSESGFSGK